MSLSLRIKIVDTNVTKTILFDPSTTVFDACRIIRDKCPEELPGQSKEYGLFLADDDNKTGVWLEPGKHLEYYTCILRNSDPLEYRRKLRTLRVKMLDGSVKTMMVDDSQIVANLMVVICAKLGITNHDEYSLVLEENIENHHNHQPENSINYGTLTLKRRREEREKVDAKMELLRKKLRTDDEVNWLDPAKTLREQGIDENETVLLRRKFFFSDQNIDSHDPIQLNLLYVQARDAIVNGTHPITENKACEFAGIQCQIQFGDHVDVKHKLGFLDLKEFLPQSYVKSKGIEKKIFNEHRRHVSLDELEAKVLYTKNARSLNTYGVTFFLVKEKMKGKNKLVPRLLGVTKDSVLRLDERTKEILQTWPLTTVRRWGASPNTFTLDFGDYSDQYYSVQTTEAEQIQQIIAGYIDIILKKKQTKDHIGIEGDEGSTMFEESVAPHRATILQHETSKVGKASTESVAKPAVMRAGTEGERTIITGIMCSAQYTTVSGQVNMGHAPPVVQQTKVHSVLSEPQHGLLSTISTTQTRIQQSALELEVRAEIPELGTDPASLKWKQDTLDTRKQNVGSQIAAMNAATAQVVTLTSTSSTTHEDTVDHNAVGAAITTIGSNLPEMTKDVKMIAALMEDDGHSGEKLLEATRGMCNAFSDLLRAAEPDTKEPRQNLLSAASRVGEASGAVLVTIGGETVKTRELQDTLLYLAKSVANTTAALVLKAKNIASTIGEDQSTQNRVIGAATQCALVTSQLVACAKVIAPTLHSPACQEQLTGAVREVALAVEHLATICNEEVVFRAAPELNSQLRQAASEVTRTLNDLLNHIKLSCRPQGRGEVVSEMSVEEIYIATDKLSVAAGDSMEMLQQAKRLAQATSQLIQSIQGDAERSPDSDLHKRLLAAAKALADATADLISFPNDIGYQLRMHKTAEHIRNVTTEVAVTTPAVRARLVDKVQVCARKAVSSASQCITAAQKSHRHNKNSATRESLQRETEELARQIPPLIGSIKAVSPENAISQVDLMYVAEVFLHPATQFVQTSSSVLPTLDEHTITEQLSINSQQLNTDLSELRGAISLAKPVFDGQGLALAAAQHLVSQLEQDLEDCKTAIQTTGTLRPLPPPRDDVICGSANEELTAATKYINQSVAQLLTAIEQHNEMYTEKSSRHLAEHLRTFCSSVRSLAATAPDAEAANRLLYATQNVIYQCGQLLSAVQNNRADLPAYAKHVNTALERVINYLPGQRDVDTAISNIEEWMANIDGAIISPAMVMMTSQKSYGDLNKAAAHLNEASSVVVGAVWNPGQLSSATKDFTYSFHELFECAQWVTRQTQIADIRERLKYTLHQVAGASTQLLSTAKVLSADPHMPNGKNQLAVAARAVTDAINQLLSVCSSAAPEQNECDCAHREIQAMRHLLDNPTEPVNEYRYYEALDSVIEGSKGLGDAMIGITSCAKQSQFEQFSEYMRVFSTSICHLVEAAAQTAYLVGVSDPTSSMGRPGLVDQAQIARAAQAIRTGCAALTSPTSPPKQVLEAATLIAKHTSSLCKLCSLASSKTNNPVAKRQFIQSAKFVANSTAALVKEIKVLDLDYSDVNRQRCADATVPLLKDVDNVCCYANSSEFVTIPAKISSQGRQSQQPIIDTGCKLIDSSCIVVEAIKNLIIMPKDPSTWQQFAGASKDVSDSIKQLVENIRNRAPGKSECDLAESILNAHLRTLDSSSLDAISECLVPRRSASLAVYCQQMERAATGLSDTIEPVRQAGKYETENIGHSVHQMIQFFDPLVQNTVDAASNMKNSKQQKELLDLTKSIAESALQLVYATKDCGGGGSVRIAGGQQQLLHEGVDEGAAGTQEAIQELLQTLEKISIQSGVVSSVVESLSRAMTKLSSNHRASFTVSDETFVEYQTRMVACTKQIAKLAGEIASKASSAEDDQQIAAFAADLSHRYTQLSNDSLGAAAVTTNTDVAMRLRDVVQQLGAASKELVEIGGQCLMRRDDLLLRDLGDASRNVIEKASRVLATLQLGARGTQACINAASTVSGIIADLETTTMFATAGNLSSENENDSFAEHRESILKTAKALVEDTKTLVAGAASHQEQLAVAAQNSVSTIVQLAEVVKFGAASLGSNNPDSQVMLINAVKDVASALADLIHSTKAASGKPINDPSMAHLKDSAKVMVTNVTSLLKTVKAVEDEHTRGTRALEATVEAIAQEIRSLYSKDGYKTNVTVEDLIRCTKAITRATTKSVAAGNSNKQEDIIAVANLARKSISDMLTVCKSAANCLTEKRDLRERTLTAGQDCAQQFRELLLAILHGNVTDAKQTLSEVLRPLAQSVTELATCAELLKGSDWVDPEDPTVIAENELLGAAASIDAAARKLASLQPRQSVKAPDVDESLNFDAMILEAAKSITYAIKALIKAASAAQRELIDSGKVARTPTSSSDDGQWSEGLISAARLVAAATHSLVESANALVQGLGSEDKLISAAKQVAASTAQLLVACKVKAEGDTDATRRLHEAGNCVIRSTDNLVQAAQQAKTTEDERCLVLNKRMVGGMAQEIDARSEVFRIERELEEARNKLTAIRQAKYKLKDTGEDTTDGHSTRGGGGGWGAAGDDDSASRYDSHNYYQQYHNTSNGINDHLNHHHQYSPTAMMLSSRRMNNSSNSPVNDFGGQQSTNYRHLESPQKVHAIDQNVVHSNHNNQEYNNHHIYGSLYGTTTTPKTSDTPPTSDVNTLNSFRPIKWTPPTTNTTATPPHTPTFPRSGGHALQHLVTPTTSLVTNPVIDNSAATTISTYGTTKAPPPYSYHRTTMAADTGNRYNITTPTTAMSTNNSRTGFSSGGGTHYSTTSILRENSNQCSPPMTMTAVKTVEQLPGGGSIHRSVMTKQQQFMDRKAVSMTTTKSSTNTSSRQIQ